jgi:lipid-binding SYLF domain-containing protein
LIQEQMETFMNQSFRLTWVTSLAVAVLSGQQLFGQGRATGTLWSASDVLDAFQAIPMKSIPPALLRDAQGVAIIPGVIKLGFGIGGRYGEGVILGRLPDGSWSNPVFITFTGGSIGWQVGIQSADIVLVFKTRKSLERVLQGKGKLTLGADAAVAAGPLGRQAEAGTDARLQAEIYSYSRSRGLFAGISLEGSGILYSVRANEAFRRSPRPETIVAAERLRAQLTAMTGAPPPLALPPQTIPPPALPPPPPLPAPVRPNPPRGS